MTKRPLLDVEQAFKQYLHTLHTAKSLESPNKGSHLNYVTSFGIRPITCIYILYSIQ